MLFLHAPESNLMPFGPPVRLTAPLLSPDQAATIAKISHQSPGIATSWVTIISTCFTSLNSSSTDVVALDNTIDRSRSPFSLQRRPIYLGLSNPVTSESMSIGANTAAITILAVTPTLFLAARIAAKRTIALPWSFDDTLLVLASVRICGFPEILFL
ncbi:hypothetical protein EJ07DRAFT_155383 [Lizonia empirigonia]|nr:hypothetical protein EJ07DRAFT_155383 [Lizonia empirigonia]